MKTEPVVNHCPKCQAPLAGNAPRGLCPKCLLAAVATPTETGQPADKNPPPSVATVAAAFPQLEIIELIGQGGMGFVYRARQPKLERFVALKLLPEALAADAAFAERFNREARVLARLNHPNIVTVHDFGQSGSFFYLLMEFVDGVNLRQAMQAGGFTPQQAMLLVPKVCEALQFAHDEGILHRDIKPENILLDTRGRVKIADFGIAKLVGEAREQLSLTASGMAIGTPHYMAPEQLEHPNEVDQRADIYSLGVVFYEMLTGELPIGRFAAPSQKSAVDPRVDAVVFHALEKERERRFRSATEVKSSVEAITATAGQAANPGTGAAASDFDARAACYFNTPKKMSDCFPSAAARIFTCKGELALNGQELSFISPWRTTIRIPLKNIEELSIGQFQMWTTPWVMKYARLNFLSITFREEGKSQCLNLTPVPPEAGSAAEINLYVGRWFERLQAASGHYLGTTPRVSEPEWLSISAEPAWNRKGLPLAFGFALTSLVAWVLMPQAKVPVPIGISLFVLSVLLLMAVLWLCAGLLQANRALTRGDLDAVTSDEPPASEAAAGVRPWRRRRPGIGMRSLSYLAVIGASLMIPVGLLLWEAWVFPSFGERIFGKHSASDAASKLVLDVETPQYGPSGHDPRQFGGQVWKFKCLVPRDHLAQIVFVRWSNSVPNVEPGFSAYYKSGHAPADVDISVSCEPQNRSPGSPATELVLWNINLGLGYTSGNLLPVKAPFRLLDTAARLSVLSGHQRIIGLLDCRSQEPTASSSVDGVELRVLLQPLKTSALRTVPSEKELNNCVVGAGLESAMEQTLTWMRRLPLDK